MIRHSDRPTDAHPAGRRAGRRAIAALAGVVVLALVTASCGGSGNGGEVPDVNDPDAPPATAPNGAPEFPLPADPGAQIRAAGLRELPEDASVVLLGNAHVDVLINDYVVAVPTGIGVTPSGRSPLNTPTDDGIVAMEAEEPEPGVDDVPPPFTLGQLFTQWGVRLDKSCVATYCTDETHQLLGFVNGQLVGDPASISFADGDQIVVWFGPRGTNPPVPATYAFPPASTR